MIKKIITITLALVMAFSVTACAKEEAVFKDTAYDGNVNDNIAEDTPDNIKDVIIKLRSNAPASALGADGTAYSGQREFAWTVADYIAAEGYKSIGEWNGNKFVDVSGSKVTYREKGDSTLDVTFDVDAGAMEYYSKNGDVLYYNLMGDTFEEYAYDGDMVAGTAVTDYARGFTYNAEKDMLLNWVVDENGYKYSTGEADYLITDTTNVSDGSAKQIFYVYTSEKDGGYQVKMACAYLDGIKKLNIYDEHISNSETGEIDTTSGTTGKTLNKLSFQYFAGFGPEQL